MNQTTGGRFEKSIWEAVSCDGDGCGSMLERDKNGEIVLVYLKSCEGAIVSYPWIKLDSGYS